MAISRPVQVQERHHKRWLKERKKNNKLLGKSIDPSVRDHDLGIFSRILGKDEHSPKSVICHKLNDLIFDPPAPRKRVRFGKIHFRNYSSTLCLNPSVPSGPAVQLGWDFTLEQQVDVDYYEYCREEWAKSIDQPECPILNNLQRIERLRLSGCNVLQIVEVIKKTDKIRRNRDKSVENYIRWCIIKIRLKQCVTQFYKCVGLKVKIKSPITGAKVVCKSI